MSRLQIVILIALILLAMLLARKVQKRKLDLTYSLSWFFLIAVFIVIDCFPIVVEKCAKLMGIELASNLLFFLGILVCLIIIYSLTTAVSRMSDEIRSLAQKIGLLQEQIDKNGKKISKCIENDFVEEEQ